MPDLGSASAWVTVDWAAGSVNISNGAEGARCPVDDELAAASPRKKKENARSESDKQSRNKNSPKKTAQEKSTNRHHLQRHTTVLSKI